MGATSKRRLGRDLTAKGERREERGGGKVWEGNTPTPKEVHVSRINAGFCYTKTEVKYV